MKVSSKDTYRELRSVLDPWMKSEAFKRTKHLLGWTRPSEQGRLELIFQCDKWGWEPDWGSSFTSELGVVSEPGKQIHNGRAGRIGYLLEGFPELEEMRALDNSIILEMPGTINGKLRTTTFNGVSLTSGVAVDPTPARYGRDFWMHYHSIEDVRKWGHFFLERFPRFFEIAESGELSEIGRARRRFDQALGNAQRARSKEAAWKTLEDYANSEADEYFASCARKWIGSQVLR